MKNYNVEAIIDFKDLEEKVQRKVGDKFKCTKERYEYLAGNNPKKKVAVKLINIDEVKKEEKTETVEKEIKPKKATKRKVK